MLSFGLNMFITNQGFAKTSMMTTCIGCGLNIILDPIFILGFDMGVQSAALATIISQAVSAVWVMSFLISKKSMLKIKFCNLKLSNNIVIGYNYGAKNMDRVKKAFKMLFIICISLSFIGFMLVEIFPSFFIGIFTPDKKLINMGILPLRIFMIGFSIFGAQCACQQTFVALGQAKISLFLALLRKVILLIPLAIVLPKIINMGVYAVVLAEPISDTIAAVTTTIMFKIKSKKLL